MNIQDFEIFKRYYYIKFLNNCKEWNLSSEPYLSIVLTDYCNSNCSFCIGDLVHNKSILDFDIMKDKVIFAVEKMGVKDVLLLGGEPTMYLKLIPTINYLRSLNLEKIVITTNGIVFAQNHSLLISACNAGLTNINLSYMSTNDEKQNKYTTCDNNKRSLNFDDLNAIYDITKKYGVKLRINNNIFLGNNDDLNSILDFYYTISDTCDSVKFSPLLKVDSFSVVPVKTKWVENHILSDECYDNLFKLIENHFINRNNLSVITNNNQFGFVKNSLIPLKTPIILNWNHRGRMLNQVLNFDQINNIKLLSMGELSLSWNRESTEYFIST